MYRRAEICEAINGRYLEALASVRAGQTSGELVKTVCRPVREGKRRYRALNPWSQPDATLLEFINRGEWTVSGFRNSDVRTALYRSSADAAEQRRQSGRVSRTLALLRAHGLIKKVSGTYRYQLTTQGRRIVSAILAARQADVEKLMAMAA